MLGIVTPAYNPSTQEVREREQRVQGYPWLETVKPSGTKLKIQRIIVAYGGHSRDDGRRSIDKTKAGI